ncbi:MAG: hypothetical protein FJX21_14775 [Alphaproteobacteria bacterium]|nr:hypothetical protein [Alphaproteobacteria bacterium]
MTRSGAGPRFDAFWAIDWSGARGRTRNIAVARLAADAGAPELVEPPDGVAWTREGVVARLAGEAIAGRRVLAGFDFAFSFPVGVFAALGLRRDGTMADVWEAVEAACAGAPGLHGGGFVEAAPDGTFWRRGPRPAWWRAPLRLVDERCAAATGARPESVMKLVGARQVGLGALAGMRSLRALRRATEGAFAAWPATAPGAGSVAVEIFPTIHRLHATRSLAKIRDAAALARALAAFGCAAPRLSEAPGDDETDALVSAAALRQIAARADAFALPADGRPALEGWIIGVPP